MPDHQTIDRRSLAFAQAIADELRARPHLAEVARDNIHRWLRTGSERVKPVLHEWLEILELPLEEVIGVLTAPDQRSTRLRQSNPFAGVLPESARNQIIRRFAGK